MVFSSVSFLFAFLPLFLAVYYLVPERGRSLWILLGSYIFFGWWRYDFLFLLIAVTAWNWLLSWGVRPTEPQSRRKALLIFGVIGNLATLGWFKYANFAAENISAVATSLGLPALEAPGVLLPVGISFYTFQSMSYLIDVYRGDATVERNPINFAAFIVVFPQLIAGPVLRYKDVADQFQARVHSIDRFAEGCRRFAVGLATKVLGADTLAPLVDHVFALEAPTAVEAWLGMIAYTVQLYLDFSGYSHMAVGLGLMMGFDFMENFNRPLPATTITEFWRRWHISLSTWLRDYLYIPLGGSRHGPRRTALALFLTMLLGGIWHGASWNMVLWGAWHGAWLVAERFVPALQRLPAPLGHLRTLLLVGFAFVYFRAPTLTAAWGMTLGLVGQNGGWAREASLAQWSDLSLFALLFGVVWVTMEPDESAPARPMRRSYALAALTVLALLRVSANSHSPFLYFQF